VVRLGDSCDFFDYGERFVRLATIDIGTNTALLLISEWQAGRLVEVFDASGFVRLGEGMDASGRVSDAALSRLQAVLFSHMEEIRIHGVTDIVITGTSASRDAQDAHRIHTLVRNITGTNYTILSGEEEANVTFLGATLGLEWMHGARADTPLFGQEGVTVVDVGGGSTEFVQGRPGSEERAMSFKKSLNIGSVRLTERFLTRQPAPFSEVDTARKFVKDLLRTELAGSESTSWCIGASGTSRILALIYHDLFELKEADGLVSIPTEEVVSLANRLLNMDYDEVVALHPAKMKGRADVLPSGALILSELLTFLGAKELIVSPFGVRHGVAIRYFRESLA
jgi:exopolyphosphatase / guanosine-5'-triphosphate,3'-diphosphate pyrophosphatase